MMEVWKPIPAFEGHYEVSNFGRVRSVDRYIEYKDGRKPRFFKGEVRPSYEKKNGYLAITLYKNRRGNNRYIHRLVLMTFNPVEDMDKLEVNHKDGNKKNNHIDNLEWADSSDNKLHAYEKGLRQPTRKLTDDDVAYIKENPDKLLQRELGAMFGVSGGYISIIQTGRKR